MIDITKKYKTRGGHAVRILATDLGGAFPVAGAVLRDEGEWEALELWQWTAEGRYYSTIDESCYDIIEAKERKRLELWANAYAGNCEPVFHPSREAADRAACTDRVACVPVVIEYEEGEGL